MASTVFGPARAVRPHLLRGNGLGKELFDLRRDVDEAFETLENAPGGAASLVFRPNEPSPTGNVFADFNDLFDAAEAQ